MDLRDEGATVDLARRCNRGLREEGATVDLREESATVDWRRRCNGGLEKKVQPWT